VKDSGGEEEEAPRAAHSKFEYQALSANSLVFYLTVNRLRYRRQPRVGRRGRTKGPKPGRRRLISANDEPGRKKHIKRRETWTREAFGPSEGRRENPSSVFLLTLDSLARLYGATLDRISALTIPQRRARSRAPSFRSFRLSPVSFSLCASNFQTNPFGDDPAGSPRLLGEQRHHRLPISLAQRRALVERN